MGNCTFQERWKEGRKWLARVAGNPHKAYCVTCKCDFMVKEGQVAVTKHETNKKHQKSSEQELTTVPTRQNSIESAFKASDEAAKKLHKHKELVAKAEAMFATWRGVHNLPECVFDCLSELLPEVFPDSKIAGDMKLHATKGTYLLNDGIAPHHQEQLIQWLVDNFFSINFDESTFNKIQNLNINVSVPDENGMIQKKHFASIEVHDGSKGWQVAEKVLNKFNECGVPLTQIISEQKDGCPAMIGRIAGAHRFLKEAIPHLPDLGGCSAHDAANVVKNGVKMISAVSLTLLYKSIWANLEKHSSMKTKNFQNVSELLGFCLQTLPQIHRCAHPLCPRACHLHGGK